MIWISSFVTTRDMECWVPSSQLPNEEEADSVHFPFHFTRSRENAGLHLTPDFMMHAHLPTTHSSYATDITLGET